MKKIRTTVILIATLAILITSQMVALASQPSKDFIAGPDRLEFLKVLAETATLELKNGNELSFVEVPGAKGQTEAVAIIEEIAPGQNSIGSMKRLEGANALEVFNALSERGTLYPESLLKMYDRPVLGPQGWAMGEMTYDAPGTGYTPPCPEWGVEAFNDALDYGMGNYTHNFKSTWDGPNAKPNHWQDAANTLANGVTTKDLYGSAYDVTAFSTAVVLCHTDEVNTVGGVYAGNFVNVKLRTTNGWYLFQSGQLDEIGKVVSVALSPAGYNQPNAPALDFRLEILNAEMNDLFHIGATWYETVDDLTFGH